MMNIGTRPVRSNAGLVTSLAWKIGGKVNYVLERNVYEPVMNADEAESRYNRWKHAVDAALAYEYE